MSVLDLVRDEGGVVTSVEFLIPLDPSDVRANIRFYNNGTLPPGVSKAMKAISEYCAGIAAETGWEPGDAYVGMDLTFYMTSRRQDVDGPLKRAMDAIAQGMGFNDNRVQEVSVRRRIDPDPRMIARVYQVPPDPDEVLPAKWRGNDPVFVG